MISESESIIEKERIEMISEKKWWSECEECDRE